MPALAPERWEALSPYLDQALEIPEAQRSIWLETLRAQDPKLAEELQTLLKEHDVLEKSGFLSGAGGPILPSSSALAGQVLGAYTLEAPIGQGGMGSVWLARRSDGRFEGHAAVKFLNVALLGNAGEARFKREGNILARLAHPNIAHLIDAGVSASGQPYLMLEYLEGEPIDRYCDEHALDLQARLRLLLEVMAAVAHAHASLIVHRDIKPSNVLVTKDGQVKLLDFGIAKLLEEEAPSGLATALTQQGGMALTLAYAAPEQVTGGAITTATDVYALGLLLYLLLTGKHPAESKFHSQAGLIKAIVETEPPRPSDVVAAAGKQGRVLQGDLDTIVAQALKKNPAQRYPSVTALAEDIRRYLGHQPISAQPDTLAYRARKFVARNRTAVALASAALVTTVAGVIGTAIQAHRARIERDYALRQLSRAEAINDLNAFVLSDAAPSGKPFTVNDLLARAEQLVAGQQGADDVNRAQLLTSLGSQYVDLGEFAKGRRTLDQAYAVTRKLGEPSTRARASCALAKALANQADLPGAERLIKEGLEELKDDARYALDRAVCLQSGSEVAVRLGHPIDAIGRARAAELALKQSPFEPAGLELDNLITVANAFRNAGQVREASAAFEQAAQRLTALGRDRTQRAALLYNNWGVALAVWGRPLEAERVIHRTITLSEDDRAGTAVAAMPFLNYARILKDLDRLDEAAQYAERGYEKAHAAGDESVVLNASFMRALIYRMQGNVERAEQMLSELEPALRRQFPPGHISFPSLTMQQALNAQARGHTQLALDLANQAVAAVESSLKAGREGFDYLRNFLLWRSAIQLQAGRATDAASDAEGALKMTLDTTQAGVLTLNLGRAYFALGRALRAQGKLDEARASLRSSVQHLESAVGADHPETREARKLADT
jgi:serine/threonine-protein kinase